MATNGPGRAKFSHIFDKVQIGEFALANRMK